MDLPCHFSYLSLDTLWPTEELPPDMRGLVWAAPTPYMVLEFCVSRLRLFRTCVATNICDVRLPETDRYQQYFLCRDRAVLMTHIAGALWRYESHMVTQRQESLRDIESDLVRLVRIGGMNKAYQQWFRTPKKRWSQRITPEDRVNDTKVKEGLAEIAKLLQAFQRNVFLSPVVEKISYANLVGGLYEAFALYGPSLERVRPVYSRRALFAALHSILAAFDLEDPADQANGSRRVETALNNFQHYTPPSVR